jgi:hypothetical protein
VAAVNVNANNKRKRNFLSRHQRGARVVFSVRHVQFRAAASSHGHVVDRDLVDVSFAPRKPNDVFAGFVSLGHQIEHEQQVRVLNVGWFLNVFMASLGASFLFPTALCVSWSVSRALGFGTRQVPHDAKERQRQHQNHPRHFFLLIKGAQNKKSFFSPIPKTIKFFFLTATKKRCSFFFTFWP